MAEQPRDHLDGGFVDVDAAVGDFAQPDGREVRPGFRFIGDGFDESLELDLRGGLGRSDAADANSGSKP